MICRLPKNIINQIAHQLLLSPDSEKTWFGQVEALCFQYGLPHPLKLLSNPPLKETFKNLVKNQVADYWLQFYRSCLKDDSLPSLEFFKHELCSLLRPHPILATASHSYEVNKMVVQLRLLSGRARLGSLVKHFSPANDGMCELCQEEEEDISHFLLPRCPLLKERANLLVEYMKTTLMHSKPCSAIFENILNNAESNPKQWLQFVLDCSALPSVIVASQQDPTVLGLMFKATRTYCYSLHRQRLKLLGRWVP